MATTELTAEQQAAWDSFQTKSFDAVQGLTHVVGNTFSQTFKAVAEPINYFNDATPSLVPGRPMTSIINDTIVQPAAEIIGSVPGNYADMKEAATFVGGVAQNMPLAPAMAVPAAVNFMTNNPVGQVGGFFQSVFNGVAVNTLQNVATPADMTNLLAGRPEFASEQGQKLINILRTDEAFSKSLHNALTKDPSVAEGFLGMNAGDQSQPLDIDKLAAQMSDAGTRAKFGKILDAVAQSPDDNLNYTYMVDVANLTEVASSGKATPEQLALLQSKLQMAGVRDMGLDMAVDPMGFFMDAMQDPVGFFKELASGIGFEGPIGDMMRGFIEAIGQFIGVATSGNTGFIDHYIKPLIDDIPNFMNQLDTGETVTTVETSVPATAPAVITLKPAETVDTAIDQVSASRFGYNIVPPIRPLQGELGAPLLSGEQNIFARPASGEEQLPPETPYTPAQVDHARAFAFNP